MNRHAFTLLVVTVMFSHAVAWDDVILPPIQTSPSLPERLLIFLPGGAVPNHYYKLTGQAIQKAATGVRLTVVIPEVLKNLCIATCPVSGGCGILHGRVADAVAKSGFKGNNPKEDTFLAGHSLGTICANNMVKGYSYQYAGLMEFGGYVDKTGDSSIAHYAIPVLHASGEVDGGSARPSTMAGLYRQSKEYAAAHSWEEALTLKPVHVLDGLDHSDFCPGFFVTKTKDCKSEVSQDTALATIGSVAAAFLHLNIPTAPMVNKDAAMDIMKKHLAFTQEMCEPYLTAFDLEKGELTSAPSGVPTGSWCEACQRDIVGLSAAASGKLQVEPCKLSASSVFENQPTTYTKVSGDRLDVTCATYVEGPGGGLVGSQTVPKSVDCKMVDATRVAQQLGVTTNTNVECGSVNSAAFEVAKMLVPAKSLSRFQQKGRGLCFMADSKVLGNIGPLWLASKVKTTETNKCLQVTSSKLTATISDPFYPGTDYCKLFSPSAAMDWMMTDSHKPFPYPKGTDADNAVTFQV